MSRRGDNDFKELELYLKQAEEDINRSFIIETEEEGFDDVDGAPVHQSDLFLDAADAVNRNSGRVTPIGPTIFATNPEDVINHNNGGALAKRNTLYADEDERTVIHFNKFKGPSLENNTGATVAISNRDCVTRNEDCSNNNNNKYISDGSIITINDDDDDDDRSSGKCFRQDELFGDFDNGNVADALCQNASYIDHSKSGLISCNNNNNLDSRHERSINGRVIKDRSSKRSTEDRSRQRSNDRSNCDAEKSDQVDCQEIEIPDVLCIYDNLEFYRQDNAAKKQNVSLLSDQNQLQNEHSQLCSGGDQSVQENITQFSARNQQSGIYEELLSNYGEETDNKSISENRSNSYRSLSTEEESASLISEGSISSSDVSSIDLPSHPAVKINHNCEYNCVDFNEPLSPLLNHADLPLNSDVIPCIDQLLLGSSVSNHGDLTLNGDVTPGFEGVQVGCTRCENQHCECRMNYSSSEKNHDHDRAGLPQPQGSLSCVDEIKKLSENSTNLVQVDTEVSSANHMHDLVSCKSAETQRNRHETQGNRHDYGIQSSGNSQDLRPQDEPESGCFGHESSGGQAYQSFTNQCSVSGYNSPNQDVSLKNQRSTTLDKPCFTPDHTAPASADSVHLGSWHNSTNPQDVSLKNQRSTTLDKPCFTPDHTASASDDSVHLGSWHNSTNKDVSLKNQRSSTPNNQGFTPDHVSSQAPASTDSVSSVNAQAHGSLPVYQTSGDNSKLDNRSNSGLGFSTEMEYVVDGNHCEGGRSQDATLSSVQCVGDMVDDTRDSADNMKDNVGDTVGAIVCNKQQDTVTSSRRRLQAASKQSVGDCSKPLNLDEFLEGINDSIDELIGSDKRSDKLGNIDTADVVSERQEDRDSKRIGRCESNKTGDIVGDGQLGGNDTAIQRTLQSLAETEMLLQNVQHKQEMMDSYVVPLVDGSKQGDIGETDQLLKDLASSRDVVETDTGYYWLSCSIEGEKDMDKPPKMVNKNVQGESMSKGENIHELANESANYTAISGNNLAGMDNDQNVQGEAIAQDESSPEIGYDDVDGYSAAFTNDMELLEETLAQNQCKVEAQDSVDKAFDAENGDTFTDDTHNKISESDESMDINRDSDPTETATSDVVDMKQALLSTGKEKQAIDGDRNEKIGTEVNGKDGKVPDQDIAYSNMDRPDIGQDISNLSDLYGKDIGKDIAKSSDTNGSPVKRPHKDNQLLKVNGLEKDTRKYSCPENFLKVFKVVSIDIPKVGYNGQVVEGGDGIAGMSRSCHTLPNRSHRNSAHYRNSMEQKKEKILSYLEEINNMCIKSSKIEAARVSTLPAKRPKSDSEESGTNRRSSSLNDRESNLRLGLPNLEKSKCEKLKPRKSSSKDRSGSKLNSKLSDRSDMSKSKSEYNSESEVIGYKSVSVNVEPPDMFRDKKVVDDLAVNLLQPPPTHVNMATQDAPPSAMSALPVWDPAAAPPGSISCRSKGQTTSTDRKYKHPSTPPPPSVDRTEKLISSTINPYKHRKYSADMNSGLEFLKPPERMRRKSADSGIQSEYVDIDQYQDSDSSSAIQACNHGNHASTGLCKDKNDNVTNSFNDGNVKKPVSNGSIVPNGRVENANKTSATNDSPGEIMNMLDLLNSYKYGSDSSDTNTLTRKKELDSKSKVINQTCHNSVSADEASAKDENDDPFPIYATVEKKLKPKTNEVLSCNKKKVLKPIPVAPPKVPPPLIPPPLIPPAIPPKPKSYSDGFEKRSPKMAGNSPHSPEMQVMINSLSPVLIRRNNSSKKRRKNSQETSPESTPEVSPREKTNQSAAKNKTLSKNKHAQRTLPDKSLFMDPKMAKTWHGATSTNWSNIYGPQMKAMMEALNEQNQGDSAKSSCTSIDMNDMKLDDYEARCQTLPSKSLLDDMHKKFCADQYSPGQDTATARALILFRLKSQSPIKPKRSQSFNIRMGTGGNSYGRIAPGLPGCSASTESSPRFPRASERLRIKTRPDVQFSPKLPTRARGATPDPLLIEEDQDEAEHTKKEEAEIEAIESCRWLRETGFPQYAQLYEDGQFPVDIESVEKDHDFLDKEDIQSLFRRLNTLNKCAIMKIGTPTKKESEDSDEDDQCALSDKWRYQRSSRRWSRKDLDPLSDTQNGQPGLKSASSHDSLLAGQNSSSETGDSPVLDSKMHHINDDMMYKTPMFDANGNATLHHAASPKMIKRTPSDRMKVPKSFLKRMESLKGKRSSRKNKTITEISGPVITDNVDMQAKIKHLNCRDITTVDDGRTTPVQVANANGEVKNGDTSPSPDLITSPRNEALTVVTSQAKTDSNSNSLNSSVVSQNSVSFGGVSVSHNPESPSCKSVTDSSTVSESATCDSSASSTNGASSLRCQSNSSDTTNSSQETLFIPGEYKPGKFPKLLDDSLFTSDSNIRTRSYSYEDENPHDKKLRRGSHDPRRQIHRVSIYDNVPIEEDLATAQEELDIILSELFQNINGLNKAINGDDAEVLEPPSFHSLDDSSVASIGSSQQADAHINDDAHNDVNSDITHDETEVISGTLSSPDISDHELHAEETSHDDSAEHIMVRERRDSGVGSSLTRTNSERRKYRIRWHSFQKSHRPTTEGRNLQLFSLSAGQLLMLRKLSLLKLTALIEKYAPNRSGWSLTVPRFMKRHKVPDYKDKNVFGVPFYVMIQRSGQALPQCILHAMRFLRRTGADSIGIFRKSGVRSRIQKLRNEIEADPEVVDFDALQAYDVADLVKQYFRELPECLLTSKLSDIFISIFIYVPLELRVEALQAAVVLMTDENRDVLQSLLLFLSDIAKHANKHQMTASNLAVCFAPSLFNMGGARNPSQTPSPRRNRKNPGVPDARELMEQKAAHECLTVMILECKKMFTIPAATLSKCRVLHEDPVTLDELNSQSGDSTDNQGYTSHIDSCIQGLLKESREKFRGWVNVPVNIDVDVSYKKVGDGHPLRLWKCTVDVEAPPNEVLNRVLNDRQQWDEDLLQWNTVEKLDKQTEVFQYVRNSMAPHPTREFCVLRSWRTDLPKGACVLISTSIDHQNAELIGGLRGVELASRYLIEPCGTGKSRLTHISRVDVRGHSPEWYKKVYGHICGSFMERIRASFHCNTDGPETKV